MSAVAYFNPFVPPEWIAAHGLPPRWLPCSAGNGSASAVGRGVCPVAAARLDDFAAESPADAVVMTTTCDQIRYAAGLLQHAGRLPVFLLHVPRTWQTAAAREYYRDELVRLGRFLLDCGGTAPDDDALTEITLHYDRSRAEVRQRRETLSAGAYAQALAAVRDAISPLLHSKAPALRAGGPPRHALTGLFPDHRIEQPAASRLAILGGPMSAGDYECLAAIEAAGARFVLDATEGGERTLPAPVDEGRLRVDPLGELCRIYFDGIPDVFQRPNTRMYDWLGEQTAQRGVQAIVLRRHVWCDHWHGEAPRLRNELSVPVLDWEGPGNDPRAGAGALGRLEAFLEMLR